MEAGPVFSTMEDVNAFALSRYGNETTLKRESEKVIRDAIPLKIQYINADPAYNNIYATYKGSSDQNYELTLTVKDQFSDLDHHNKNWAIVTCTCPVGSRKLLCKHGLGLLISRASRLSQLPLQEQFFISPPTQQPRDVDNQDLTTSMNAAPTPSRIPTIVGNGSRLLPMSFQKVAAQSTGVPNIKKEPQQQQQPMKKRRTTIKKEKTAAARGDDDGFGVVEKKRWMTADEMMRGSDEDLLEECRRLVGDRMVKKEEKMEVFDMIDLIEDDEPVANTENHQRHQPAAAAVVAEEQGEKQDEKHEEEYKDPYLDLFNSML